MVGSSHGSLYYLVFTKALVPLSALSKSSRERNHRSIILCVFRAASVAVLRGLVLYGFLYMVPIYCEPKMNRFPYGFTKGNRTQNRARRKFSFDKSFWELLAVPEKGSPAVSLMVIEHIKINNWKGN